MFVGMARFELATSWSQTRRDNRATLHPELIGYRLKYFLALFCIGWQDLNLRPSRSQSGRYITGLRYIPNYGYRFLKTFYSEDGKI